MKYSSYFKERMDLDGLPQLNLNQFKRYISIIEIEKTLLDIEKGKSDENLNRADLIKELDNLTNNYNPEELYHDLLNN